MTIRRFVLPMCFTCYRVKCTKTLLAEAGIRTRVRWVQIQLINLCTKNRYIQGDVCGLTKKHKTGTSEVGAISKTQKVQSFLKYAQNVFMESSEINFETTKGCLSCSIILRNPFSPNGKKTFSVRKFRYFSF